MLKLLAQPFHPLTLPAPTSFANQTLLITGANTGVGLEAARHALTLHAAKVILGPPKADLLSTTGAHPSQIDLWALDLASFASVKAFAARVEQYFRDGQGRIDVAIMNAGMASGEWHVTEDGWERTIQVNGLATAFLSLRVLNVLLAQAREDETLLSHLVIVASDVHMSAGLLERYQENTLAALNDRTQWERSAAANGPAERYVVSKLLDVYVMLELAEMVPQREDAARTPWVVVNAVTSGFCKSELLTREKAPVVLRVMQWLTGRTTEEGGKALVDAAASEVESHGGWLENQAVADPGEIVTSKEGVRTRKKVWREMLEVLRKVDLELPSL
ncbi:putative short-chain dehydrogenase [Aspergillus brunneoviolaceus CBS 621.78]|uniref:Short-chain dehydrogenase n=1 Tax=Aspergillus brunneoviolaceus CBS 621.78 TaxID=1450534 RepID=A0ACD1FY15_9EURO|nr:putative short-chain dehydrogenase [Aspergillus brunneoviolaceus CBS 621.78]RAH41842.1 putative short-chain dehydrogenase [Aspergillus brunneoviolaceus CBS 621.78]